MHKAVAGGEIGANGEFYKGGQFVADTEGWVKGSSRWEGIKGEGISVYRILGSAIYKDEHWDETQGKYVIDGIYLDDRISDYDGECRRFYSYLLSLYKDSQYARISRQDIVDLEFACGLRYWWGVPNGARLEDLTSLAEADIPAYMERVDAVISAHGITGAKQLLADREDARKAAIVSKHIGQVGDKMERDVELTDAIPFESDFGGGTIYKFKDAEGNELVWMTSSALKTGKDADGYDTYAGVGDKLRIKFTVKAHENYCDVPQTKIFRVKAVA